MVLKGQRMKHLSLPVEPLTHRNPTRTTSLETVEEQAFQRLMENVHMQGFRNPEE
jgi:hypothetical protein